jgi:hypothetical protein
MLERVRVGVGVQVRVDAPVTLVFVGLFCVGLMVCVCFGWWSELTAGR